MIVLDVLLYALVVLLAIPVGTMVVSILAAVFLPTRPLPLSTGPRPPLAVLIPAHDEALVIAATLASIRPQLAAGDRVVVIADNCTDDTAAIARAAGAEVLERHDTVRRGKGYALDHGVRHLEAQPPAVVVFVDADCDVKPGAIDLLARRCQYSGRPVQATYNMLRGADNHTVPPISAFAWKLRTMICPLGMHHLGCATFLMGSGMALPWPLARDLPLASGQLVEDMQMTLDLARRGSPPVMCPQAVVTSEFPVSRTGASSQRTRWEHGHLGMIVTQAPRLLSEISRGVGAGLLPLTLDLCVPPKALLVMLLLSAALLSGLGAAIGASSGPFVGSLLLVGLFLGSVWLAWARFGRDIVPPSEAFRVAKYVFAKIPLYLRFLVRRQVEWVRSKRDAD
jgi:GTP:adenosylcobinamide-phosphate guanylyltransferase